VKAVRGDLAPLDGELLTKDRPPGESSQTNRKSTAGAMGATSRAFTARRHELTTRSV